MGHASGDVVRHLLNRPALLYFSIELSLNEIETLLDVLAIGMGDVVNGLRILLKVVEKTQQTNML